MDATFCQRGKSRSSKVLKVTFEVTKDSVTVSIPKLVLGWQGVHVGGWQGGYGESLYSLRPGPPPTTRLHHVARLLSPST